MVASNCCVQVNCVLSNTGHIYSDKWCWLTFKYRPNVTESLIIFVTCQYYAFSTYVLSVTSDAFAYNNAISARRLATSPRRKWPCITVRLVVMVNTIHAPLTRLSNTSLALLHLIDILYIHFYAPPFKGWWRGIKCYPCPSVRPSVRYQNLVSA